MPGIAGHFLKGDIMVRLARLEEFDDIWEIYLEARQFMRDTGNPNQWGDFSPTTQMLKNDIELQRLYVVEREGRLCGSFMFAIGPDPWYAVIDNGAWKNDTPYGVLHRVAAKTKEKGVFRECMDFALSKIRHLRIDTHEENKVMQHVLNKNGFVFCGTVYMDNGEPRIAFEYVE